MNALIYNIWKKYHRTRPAKEIEEEILKKAKTSYKKAGKKFKLDTYISWWTRKYATKTKTKLNHNRVI